MAASVTHKGDVYHVREVTAEHSVNYSLCISSSQVNCHHKDKGKGKGKPGFV